jgi:hypothetical protein
VQNQGLICDVGGTSPQTVAGTRSDGTSATWWMEKPPDG